MSAYQNPNPQALPERQLSATGCDTAGHAAAVQQQLLGNTGCLLARCAVLIVAARLRDTELPGHGPACRRQ